MGSPYEGTLDEWLVDKLLLSPTQKWWGPEYEEEASCKKILPKSKLGRGGKPPSVKKTLPPKPAVAKVGKQERAHLNFWVYRYAGRKSYQRAKASIRENYPNAFRLRIRDKRIHNLAAYNDEAVVWVKGFDKPHSTIHAVTLASMVANGKPFDLQVENGKGATVKKLWRPAIFIIVSRREPRRWYRARKGPHSAQKILNAIDHTSVYLEESE